MLTIFFGEINEDLKIRTWLRAVLSPKGTVSKISAHSAAY